MRNVRREKQAREREIEEQIMEHLEDSKRDSETDSLVHMRNMYKRLMVQLVNEEEYEGRLHNKGKLLANPSVGNHQLKGVSWVFWQYERTKFGDISYS